MFVSIADIIDPAARRAGREPVRRHSNLKGRCEGLFWRKMTKAEAWRVVYAAERFDLAGKAAGDRTGPLGPVALEILRFMARLMDTRTGRLDPSIEYLMRVLKRSRDSIWRALKALRAHGFLDWLRRYVPTGADTGPKVQQTSNAYRLSLPARAMRLLRHGGRAAPMPDDFSHAQAMRSAAIEEHRRSLSLAELPLFDMGADDPLALALSRLGKAIEARKERGSDERTELKTEI